MTETQRTNNSFVFEGNQHVSVSQANDQAQAHQYNLVAPQAQLQEVLDQVLAETASGEPQYADLRAACQDAQGELQQSGALTAPTKTRLQKAIDAFPTVDKAVGFLSKLAAVMKVVVGA